MSLQLRNPHSVIAAFRERPEDVIDVRLPAGRLSEGWEEVGRLATNHRVPLLPSAAPNERMNRRSHKDDQGGRLGAAEATVKEREAITLEELFGIAAKSEATPLPRPGTGRRVWLALDQVQDPHNVGAIFRTAAFFGVAGILITRDRSSPINGTVYDVASGGLERVPFANPVNLIRALEVAKQAGLWVLGASEHAEQEVQQVDRERSWLLVLGNEEKGLRRLTLENCDETCRIAPRGSIGSLNVSVAAGVLLSTLTSPSIAGR